ncbi:MAG: hypothetical protein IPF68_14005 [Bacteroidales bacterium]|nr:hypothetical protein [Bacteroidales bacterium]
MVNYSAIDKMTSWSKSPVKLILKPPTTLDTVTSTERSGDFKRWLTGDRRILNTIFDVGSWAFDVQFVHVSAFGVGR